MGLMTLADYRAELTYLMKGRTDAAVDNDRLDRTINQAYSHLCQPETRLHKELKARYDGALTDGTNEYDISIAAIGWDVLFIRDVTYYEAAAITATTTKRDVAPVDVNWFNARTIPIGGAPSKYAQDGELLLIYPVPSAVEDGNLVRITHYREPEPLSLITDTTVLGTYWDRVLLRGAQWLLEYDAGLRELAVLTKQEYVGLINEKRDDYELNAADTGFGVEFKNERIM